VDASEVSVPIKLYDGRAIFPRSMDKSFAASIDLNHGVISREPNTKESIKQKSNFVKPRLSMV
jgi:hypothetical protein